MRKPETPRFINPAVVNPRRVSGWGVTRELREQLPKGGGHNTAH